MVFELNLVVNTQLHNLYGRSFARVQYFVLVKDIGPVTPLSVLYTIKIKIHSS